jgi:hypothetical protein
MIRGKDMKRLTVLTGIIFFVSLVAALFIHRLPADRSRRGANDLKPLDVVHGLVKKEASEADVLKILGAPWRRTTNEITGEVVWFYTFARKQEWEGDIIAGFELVYTNGRLASVSHALTH